MRNKQDMVDYSGVREQEKRERIKLWRREADNRKTTERGFLINSHRTFIRLEKWENARAICRKARKKST